jgi:hypothetical protein
LYFLFKIEALVYKAIELINKATLNWARGKKAWNYRIFTKSNISKVLKYTKDILVFRELSFKLLLANKLIKK